MEPTHILQTAAALFATGALGGLLMAGMRLRGAPRPPSIIAMAHGVMAAAGLTLLIYAALTVGIPPLARLATLVLLLAALGGAWINLRFHARMLELPIKAIAGHALAAVIGLGLLVLAVMRT